MNRLQLTLELGDVTYRKTVVLSDDREAIGRTLSKTASVAAGALEKKVRETICDVEGHILPEGGFVNRKGMLFRVCGRCKEVIIKEV